MRAYFLPLAAPFVLALTFGCGSSTDHPLEASVDCFGSLAALLSTDEMEGRGVGTEGLERAAALIQSEFERAGLFAAGGNFRQTFQVRTGVERGGANELSWNGNETEIDTQFVPLGFSSNAEFAGELAFVGYGIRATDLNYDDFAGIDVSGKVVLAMRYEPGERDPDSPFNGSKPSRYSDLRDKALRAREAGAAALIFVNPPSDEGDDRLPRLRSGAGPISRAGIPVMQISIDLARSWLQFAGRDLAQIALRIDEAYQPQSFVVRQVTIRGATDLRETTADVSNVIGIYEGAGGLADEVVVVGAHYDHLGYGGAGSMSPDVHAIHNGADDNASGVAAMVCGVGDLAPELDSLNPRRTLIAIAFAAEEIGLGGSGWYVDEPVRPLDQTVAMINLDMVGRVENNAIQVMGTDSSDDWPAIVQPAAQDAGLNATMGGDGYGPSDQTSFYEREIPVVHLFSGTHPQYHRPEDDADLLNVDGGAKVARLTANLLEQLLSRPQPLGYKPSTSGPLLAGDSRGYGAYLGTIPDSASMMASDGGVLLSGVREGGPADEAGIRGGDRIVGMGGTEIQNLYDMTFVLRDHKPGDVIAIELLRGDEKVLVSAQLGDRSRREDKPPASPHGVNPHGASPHG